MRSGNEENMIKSKRRSRNNRRNKQKRINKANSNRAVAEEENPIVSEDSVKITEINESSDSEILSENKGVVCEVTDNEVKTETPIQRKAKKKEALMEYFLPVYYNPRFLEVISEESSDASDKETKMGYIEIPTHSQEIIGDTNVEVVFLQETDVSDGDDVESNCSEKNLIEYSITQESNSSEDGLEQIDRISAISPPRSRSSSNGSSSRGTSLCTARYNPSISDVAALAKDIEFAQLLSNLKQPLSLRELCVNFLLLQPFGADVLKELANVSKVIDEFMISDNVNYELFLSKLTQKSDNNKTINIPVEMKPKENEHLYLYFEENDKCRLQAKELSEWLELARNKSVSETNLTKKSNYSRRASLPNDFYKQQLFLIQEKEREIQRQLEELEEEKRKLLSAQFKPEDYIISSKGDIAIYNEKKKPFNTIATPTEAEIFRQQMYDEYMQQLAEG